MNVVRSAFTRLARLWSSGRNGKIAIIGGVIVLLALCGAIGRTPKPATTQNIAAIGGGVGSTTPQASATVAATPTLAPTVVREVTRLVEVTRIVVVTATPSTPTAIPPPTLTPTEDVEATSEAIISKQKTETAANTVGDGFYLVGVDIKPGTYRSNSKADGCYWARTDKNQGIIDNHFGLGGGTVTIRASDFQFETRDCGEWTLIK